MFDPLNIAVWNRVFEKLKRVVLYRQRPRCHRSPKAWRR